MEVLKLKRQTGQVVFIVIIALSIIGLVSTSLWKLLQMIVMMALFGVIIYFGFRFLQRRNGSWKYSSQYRKAVRQSKKRYPVNKVSSISKKTAFPTSSKRKSSANLTVIEGRKTNKKKNRALY
jgi:predicted negative regulator of RcsB-dependent stress response